jgi:AAA+ ATPase superfamily predicted ATPase
MQTTDFVGRKEELAKLNRLWKMRKSMLLVLCGRRRVGKTRLLQEFAQDKHTFYWSLQKVSAMENLHSFLQAVDSFTPGQPANAEDDSPSDLANALKRLSDASQGQRLVVILDELNVSPDTAIILVSAVCLMWKNWLEKSNLLLILCGSNVAALRDYHREAAEHDWNCDLMTLKDLPREDMEKLFGEFTEEQFNALHAILGGLPAYWQQFNLQRDLWEDFQAAFLDPRGPFHQEVYGILADNFSRPEVYFPILLTIAQRICTFMSNYRYFDLSWLEAQDLINDLCMVDLVTVTPSIVPGRTAFTISDRFLDFYFTFVFQNEVKDLSMLFDYDNLMLAWYG